MPPPLLARLLRRRTTTRIAVRTEGHRAGGRAFTVWLPPGYDPAARRGRPVLVAHDGQEMDAWRLRAALEDFAAVGGEAPVVVALPAGDARLADYGTAGTLNAQGHGARAAEFQKWVVHAVLPHVCERCHVRAGPEHTVVMGASLGGLSAFDLAWRHPGVFGTAGIFSGSLWWRTDDSSPAAQSASRILHARVRAAKTKPRGLRLWFQAGTCDETSDRDGDGVIDAIQDTTELIHALAARGFARGREVVYRETPGGEHGPATWAAELPGFLRWAFPP